MLIAKRVSEDVAWRKVQVIFSGPEVPGEGEHKIMEFIRLTKAKADYDPNVRHCLYGLDADLILLGLLSHDPHFALLREEVTFGGGSRANTVKKSAADTRFYLMHLCLMREYMGLEFAPLIQASGNMLTLEKLIDDFILLMCLVGNDFMPSLPGFHLGEGVLEILFDAYKQALPHMKSSSGGFLNLNGRICFQHMALVLHELIPFEISALLVAEPSAFDEAKRENCERLVQFRRELARTFLQNNAIMEFVRPVSALTAKERSCLSSTAQRFGFYCRSHGDKITVCKPEGFLIALARNEMAEFERETEGFLQKNDTDHVHLEWKRAYYGNKLEFDVQTPAGKLKLRDLMADYCQGLQWNMLYYYNGVASWSWFYPYHYAPHISDLATFMAEFVSAPFDLASPLRPLEQLMAVLPPASAKLVPLPLATLMTSNDSPVLAFYPTDFTTDANGKKASWEAIVKIPFIDEEVLLPAIDSKYCLLNPQERARNQFGTTYTFEYSSSAPHVTESIYELPVLMPDEKFVAALCRGARVGLHAMPGFPTLATLPVEGVLDSGVGLEIFGQPARGLSMVLQLGPGGVFGREVVDGTAMASIALGLIGQRVFINWPHLREAVVDRISDGCHAYSLDPITDKVIMSQADDSDAHNFEHISEALRKEYQKRCAVAIGLTPAIAWVRPFVGMRMSADGAILKDFSRDRLPCALQTLVLKRVDATGTETIDERYEEQKAGEMDLSRLFPINAPVVYLGRKGYGRVGKIVSPPHDARRTVAVQFHSSVAEPPHEEPDWPHRLASTGDKEASATFFSFRDAQRRVGISSLLLAKLTSSLMLFFKGEMVRASNLGLDLKSEKRKTCAWGLARRIPEGWVFAPRVVNLLMELKQQHPGVFAALELVKGDSNINAESIFAGVKSRDELQALVAPLQEVIRTRLGPVVHVAYEGDYLHPATIHQIQTAWHDYERNHCVPSVQDATVPVETVISPLTGVLRLRSQQTNCRFALGHRIAYVGQGSIPFGVKGVVVGIDPGLTGSLWVVLDQPIIGGGDLDGMCQGGCGVVVEKGACLNLNVPLDWKLKSEPLAKVENASMGIMSGTASRTSHQTSKPPSTPSTITRNAPLNAPSNTPNSPPLKAQGRSMRVDDLITAVSKMQILTPVEAPPASTGGRRISVRPARPIHSAPSPARPSLPAVTPLAPRCFYTRPRSPQASVQAPPPPPTPPHNVPNAPKPAPLLRPDLTKTSLPRQDQ